MWSVFTIFFFFQYRSAVVRYEMNFTISLTVPMKMSKETVLSMFINIILIIPACPNSAAS